MKNVPLFHCALAWTRIRLIHLHAIRTGPECVCVCVCVCCLCDCQKHDGGGSRSQVIGREQLQALLAELDPNERLDDSAIRVLQFMASDFVNSVARNSAALARHRHGNQIEAKVFSEALVDDS